MVKLIKWLDRKFEFNQPAGMMPVNLVRMRGTIIRIEDLVNTHSDSELSLNHAGAWSIKEHIGHLVDLEDLHIRRLEQILKGESALTAADMSNRKTNEANHNSKSAAQLLEEFRSVRTSFIEKLEVLDEKQVLLSALHPRLNKPMRIIDIAFFAAEHDDHHIAIMYGMNK